MTKDLEASRKPSATTMATAMTTLTIPIHKEKLCLHVKPQTRQRSAHREGPGDEDLCNKKVPEVKICMPRRSGDKGLCKEKVGWQRPTRQVNLTILVIEAAEEGEA
jgi:hypothetical protein